MNETLLLRMPDTGQPASWLAVDAFGNRMGHTQSGTLAEAAAAASGRKLRVCVPGAAVTLLHAEIPTHNAQKLLQAIPFALEDKLAEDVETLHFAVGQREADGYPVAVITRARMRQWLEDLTAAGLQPVELVPDTLALPTREHTLVLVSDGQHVLTRFPNGIGIAAGMDLMSLLIRRQLSMLPETQGCTHALIYASSDAEAQAIGDLIKGLSLEIAFRPLTTGVIGLMATTVQDSAFINLLQAEFSRHGSVAEHWRRWSVAAALLIALCVIFIVQQGISEFRLQHEAENLNIQVTSLFHQALPDITRIVDPQAQMQQRLTQLTGGGADNSGLLPMLAAVGVALKSQTGVQLQGFSYHGGSLQLQVQAASIDALNDMKSRLAQNSSLQVNLDSVNSNAGQTTGRLTLSGGHR